MSTFSLTAALAGAALGASLIIAIGAQNAFVLRQGLRREHVLAVVSICALVDATLITLGVVGFGSLIARLPEVVDLAAWGGAAFLVVYGALAFRAAATPKTMHAEGEPVRRASPLAPVVGATLAVSLLNPHVYLDTVVLLGSVASQYPATLRASFALGAITASFVWFFSLGFGARALAPIFGRPVAWRILDAGIGVIMWTIAFSLVRGVLYA